MEWLTQLLAKASPQDLVALTGMGLIVWLVSTKRQIARGTVELALKLIAGIVAATIIVRVSLTILLALT